MLYEVYGKCGRATPSNPSQTPSNPFSNPTSNLFKLFKL